MKTENEIEPFQFSLFSFQFVRRVLLPAADKMYDLDSVRVFDDRPAPIFLPDHLAVQFDGDTLRWCYATDGGPRPTSFADAGVDGSPDVRMLTMRRAPPAAK